MSGNYHYGDEVTQYGDHNIGMIKNQSPADPQTAFREMINAVQILRTQVSPADRQVIDESLHAMSPTGAAGTVEPSTLRRALGAIAGVATMVGQTGAPVIEAVRQVMAAFGV